ncbi:uncharacterized protein BDR25DRAFT_386055 [Lindgomyces ingoldianus]|uniref:Uncharacterized protein n=1 Tax=Lindgomyces ingoldianus TaxID=673940 RepID=A0ACB6Q7K7_9PLEO|nr:uncharacterized protein BDR25DRAFT_386055 [Lindgomyces ingoldianus]KAF2462826.1 hypothetical protein BDR25DRAFT_386055 [Lindgomyces ingoldianus]
MYSLVSLLIATTALTSPAVYFITNNAQNAVVALPINSDGTLGDASVTATGGAGSNSIDGATKQPAVPDALVGQSALTVSGQNIFAVNAGSNTVSMFAISPNDPLKLQQVGQPAALPGTFPNTVAASSANSLVCVGTTGSKAGVSCANFDTKNGIGQMDSLRPFDLGQSDPPVGPTNTVSQTFFSEDETMLFTTVKGDPAANKTGFLTGAGAGTSISKLSTQETQSSPPGTAVLFGSQPIPGQNQIFATDASFGAGILSLDSSNTATLIANQSINGQKATCWATISLSTNSAFVTDVGVNRIVEMSLKDASIVGVIDLSTVEASAADPGLIDLKAAGNFLYALSPGNGTSEAAISVVDVKSKKLVQHATLKGVGAGANAQGIAVLL